jgi:21S rRNA (GM2251-2'-O)-methyltransferase
LSQAKDDGFRIIGASSSVPRGEQQDGEDGDTAAPVLYDLQDLPACSSSSDDDEQPPKPVLLVLGSEGHGLRTLVAKACTEFVRIPAGGETDDAVDSLNVSVTGGILLWHLLNGGGKR